MNWSLKQLRTSYGLSQVQLSNESEVSLPTIQNIEAGKANPTLEVISKLMKVFGLQIQIVAPSFSAERAATFGVPLLVEPDPSFRPNKKNLTLEVRTWIQQVISEKVSARDKDAIIAFCLAIRLHYPKFYAQKIASPILDRLTQNGSNDARNIKLYRLALAKMSQYL